MARKTRRCCPVLDAVWPLISSLEMRPSDRITPSPVIRSFFFLALCGRIKRAALGNLFAARAFSTGDGEYATFGKDTDMNWDQIEGKWKQLKGQAQSKWGDITGDDWDKIDGRREEIVGLVQERYGKERAEVEKDVDSWLKGLNG